MRVDGQGTWKTSGQSVAQQSYCRVSLRVEQSVVQSLVTEIYRVAVVSNCVLVSVSVPSDPSYELYMIRESELVRVS